MKVIVVANQKGGVGKSTIACNLAVNFAVLKKHVLLIDTDIQESSISFRAMRQSDDITSISIKALYTKILEVLKILMLLL